jgi:hypothetical protein
MIFASESDPHAAAVREELTSRGVTVLTFNLSTIADHDLTITPGTDVQIDGVRIDDEWTVWWRRIGGVPDHPRMSELESQLRREEIEELLLGGLLAAGPRWVDQPHQMAHAEHKLVQLAIAAELRVPVPRTVATNQSAAAHELMAAGRVVAKAASAGIGLAPFADRFDNADIDRLAVAPTLLQHRVDAVADLRVVVIADRSWVWRRQREGNDPIDWRAADPAGKQFVAHTDSHVGRAAELITARLGLSVSIQDWLVDRDGQCLFLEANPAGGWLFLAGADQLVPPALADHLTCGRSS